MRQKLFKCKWWAKNSRVITQIADFVLFSVKMSLGNEQLLEISSVSVFVRRKEVDIKDVTLMTLRGCDTWKKHRRFFLRFYVHFISWFCGMYVLVFIITWAGRGPKGLFLLVFWHHSSTDKTVYQSRWLPSSSEPISSLLLVRWPGCPNVNKD